MNSELRRNLLLLTLVVLIAFLGFRSFGWLRDSAAGEALGLPGRQVDVSSQLGTRVVELRTGDLVPQAGELTIGRDPWRYGQPPRPEPTPMPTPVTVATPAPTPVPPAPTPGPETNRPRPPAIDVKYIGSFGPESRRIAVFVDGETVINALQGEVVNGKFEVHSIGYESVDLAFVGFPDEPPQRLPLDGMDAR